MIKYVKVKFNDYGEFYVFKIPNRISVDSIQKYVIVENANYDKYRDISPYKIVKVVELVDESLVNESDYDEMKYIVDTIDGNSYRAERKELKEKQKNKKIVEKFFSNLSYEDQIAILLNSTSYEDFVKLIRSY